MYFFHVAVKKDVEPSCDEESENGVVLGMELNVDGYGDPWNSACCRLTRTRPFEDYHCDR